MTRTFFAPHSLLTLLLGMLLLLGAAPLRAAEAESSDNADAEAETTETSTGAPPSEVFIPTEEISEDFAVSFPVDI